MSCTIYKTFKREQVYFAKKYSALWLLIGGKVWCSLLVIAWDCQQMASIVARSIDFLVEVTFSLCMLLQSWALITKLLFFQGGDSGSKRPKFDQDGKGDIVIEPHLSDDKPMRLDQESSSSSHRDAEASTSTSVNPAKTEETGAYLLPVGLNDMKISDDKVDGRNDKVILIFSFHDLLIWYHLFSCYLYDDFFYDCRKLKGLP